MTGETPPVVDARDIGTDAEGTLRMLCAALKVAFDPAMLRWPAGPRDSDGIWAKHWYANVNKSTGFRPWKARTEHLPDRVKPLLDELTGIYQAMHKHRLCG
jgi:hypothetical protein